MRLAIAFISTSLAISTFVSNMSTAADEPSYPPTASLETVRQDVDKTAKNHPRLLTTQAELSAIRGSLDEDPLRRQLADVIVLQADLLLDATPITRKMQGKRLLSQSRRCVSRVATLAMAFHLTGNDKYSQRCETEMLAAARFTDWNPSHFLDVAEMTFALAIGYDWLFNQLDDPSRAEIRQAIIDKGVTLPFTTRHKGWVRASNNWGQVCHGGLTAGALAVMEHEPGLAAQTIHNALHNVTRSMAAYAPCGSYPEGPGYWSYGTSYNVLLIGVLESCLKTDYGLSQAPGLSDTGQYLSLTCGPSGRFFNFADGGANRSHQPALFWFASRFSRPDWLLGERERLASSLASLKARSTSDSGGRLLPFSLLWMPPPAKNVRIAMPLDWHSHGHTPVTIHRTSWTDPNATYVGLKAGSPRASHGQMDIGSFVLDADGVRWAMDLGAESYHGIESRGMNLWDNSQNSDRWTIFRQSNEGHNTLVIDGKLQRVTGTGTIAGFSDDHDSAFSVVDMSSVYDGQAKSVLRGVRILPSGEVLIQDQLTGLKPGSRVRWGMVTRGRPDEKTDGRMIKLHQKDAQFTLSLLSPEEDKWQIIDTETPRNEWDSPNRNTRMVAFESTAPESGSLTLAVLATPGSCTKSAKDDMTLVGLEDWLQMSTRR